MSDQEPSKGSAAGRIIIFSGPSGSGKTTVLQRVLAQCARPLEMSVSATTRPQRPGEVDGTSYHYLTDEQFQEHRTNGDFLECVEVFGRGHWYGTLRTAVEGDLADGKWVILEIDVEGAQKVLAQFPDAITIFVHPGSVEELERRLRGRATESEEALQRRLEVGKKELDASSSYQNVVINHSVEQTTTDICQILESAE